MSWNSTCRECGNISARIVETMSLQPEDIVDLNRSGASVSSPLVQYAVDNGTRNSTVLFGVDDDLANSRHRVLVVVVTVILSIITFVTIVANLMILLAFATAPKLRKPTNYFYVSMAVSDFAAGLLVLPLGVYDWYQNEYWRLGKATCVFWVTMDYFLYTATAYIMCAICLDRYLAIFHSFWYRRKRSGKLVFRLIIVAWIIGFLGEVPATTLWETFAGNSTITYDSYCDVEFVDHSVYTSIKMFFSPILPCTFIFVLYLRIYITIRRRSDRRKASLDKLLMTSESRTFASPQRVLVYEKLGSKRREWIHMSRKSSPDVLSDFNSTVMRETTPSLQSGRLRGDTSTRVSVEHHRESRGTQETEFICDKNGDSASQSQRVPEMDTTQTNSATSEDSQVPLRREEDKSSTATDASDKLLAYCSGRRDIEKSSVINSSSARTSPRKESVVFQDSPACARGYRSKHIVRQSSSDRRAAVLLTILVGFFLLSYLPWVIISIYEAIRPDHALPFTIYTVAVWLQYVNSLINPFLYVYQDLEFRHAVVAVLTKPSILFVRLTL